MIDIFLGQKNKKVIEKAKKLGFSEVLFVKIIENIKEINKEDAGKFDCCVVKTKEIEQFRRIIDKSCNIFEKIIVLGTTNEINRLALEHKKVFALLNPEYSEYREKDYLDSRNSGLNQVLCKIALEGKKKILVSLDSLRDEKSLGRVIQNFRLCKKFGTEIQLVNFVSSLDGMKSAFELKEVERVLKNKEHFERESMAKDL